MPIRPNPFNFECGDCGWKKTVVPKSDCLGPGDWFVRCPKCGNNALKMRTVSGLERFLVELWPRR
jgi:Zn finger protein HypA/HybF involved in hydrogenase expression